MATFCTKCGASLTSDTGFCPSCGTPIGAEAVTSQPMSVPATPLQAPPPPPTYGQPASAYPVLPPKKSGGALKIILIVIAVVVGLGVLGVGAISYVAYRAIHTNGNSLSLGKSADISDEDLGVSVYPGATRNPSGAMKMKLANILTVSAGYTTTDPAASVLTFYQDKLGPTVTSRESGAATTLTSATITNSLRDTVVVTVTPTGQAGTQIMIVHSKTTSQ